MTITMILAGVFILSLLLVILPHIAWIILLLLSKLIGFSLSYAPFGWTALGLILAGWLVMGYGCFIERWHVETTTLNFVHKEVPAAFDGYRIVHISDLHLSTFNDNKKKLDQFVQQINLLHPDIICFTGDLVTMGVEEATPYLSTLQKLHARDGVISVFGNHDFMLYSLRKLDAAAWQKAVDSLHDFETATLGWHLLRNQNIVFSRGNDTIAFVGVDNIQGAGQGFQTINRGDLSKAMEGAPPFSILLTHDPSHWMFEVVPHTTIPLTLSGHTHAAQIKLFGWTPAQRFFKQTDGLYTHHEQSLYVNRGLGCTFPFRLGARPEITVITLKQQ